ncbi:MAG: hypothetical protein ABUL67_00325, partial [Haliangium ochraceum]
KKMRERREFVERFGGEERPNIESEIDYRRKRGMLEEINRAVREVAREEDDMDRIQRQQAMDESGPVDLPVGPGTSGGETAPGAGAAPPAGSAPPAPAPGPAAVPSPGPAR